MKKIAKINWFGLWRNQGGFTLTEALISVALLSTGLMAYGTLSGSIMQSNTHSERESIATTLAQDKIEEIKNMVVGNAKLGNAIYYVNPVPFGSGWQNGAPETLNAEGGTDGVLQYKREWQIIKPTATQIASDGRDGSTGTISIYDVRVRVSWNNNGPHNVEFSTRVSD